MNVADVKKLIEDGFVAASVEGVPVVPPGTPVVVLPAVVLRPGPDELTSGNRSLRHGLDVAVLVPRSDQVSRYSQLEELLATVLRSLRSTEVQFVGPIEFGEGLPTEPPAMSRTIPVSFAGDVDLC